MEITENLIETLYKRAMEYCVAKYGFEADEIKLDDGCLTADFISYSCGDRDVDSYTILAEHLTIDLDEVYKTRKKKEEEESLKREVERKRINAIRIEQEKKKRKADYLKLKKEFD